MTASELIYEGIADTNHFISNTTFAHTTSSQKSFRSRRQVPAIFRGQAASLTGHFCYKGRHGAPRNQTLRENAELVYKTGNHQSATTRQRLQRLVYNILG